VITRATPFLLTTLTCSLVILGCGRAATNSPKGPDATPAARQEPMPQAPPDGASTPATGKVAAPTPLGESARALVGTWHCSGSLYGTDGKASPSEVALEVKLDLDAAWLKSELRVTSGKYSYGFNAYRAFDTAASQWVNVIVDNRGGHAVSRSTDGVIWTGESTGPMG
jgi:hypothetical protein